MHFSPPSPTSQSSISSCLLPPAVLGSYCSVQGFGFQFKVGVTPKPLFSNLENTQSCTREFQSSGRDRPGLSLSPGIPWKRIFLFLLPNHHMPPNWKQHCRHREGGQSPVKPSLSDNSATHPSCSGGAAWGRHSGAAQKSISTRGKSLDVTAAASAREMHN